MNLDNRRLQEIQQFKAFYHKKLDECESISECIQLKAHMDKLNEEESQILSNL